MTKSKVKRFDFDSLLNGEVRMAELHDGDWVRYEDMLAAFEALASIAEVGDEAIFDKRVTAIELRNDARKALERIGKGGV